MCILLGFAVTIAGLELMHLREIIQMNCGQILFGCYDVVVSFILKVKHHPKRDKYIQAGYGHISYTSIFLNSWKGGSLTLGDSLIHRMPWACLFNTFILEISEAVSFPQEVLVKSLLLHHVVCIYIDVFSFKDKHVSHVGLLNSNR